MSDLRIELREFRNELREFRGKVRAARAVSSQGGRKITKEEAAEILPELMDVITEGAQFLGAAKEEVEEIVEFLNKRLG